MYKTSKSTFQKVVKNKKITKRYSIIKIKFIKNLKQDCFYLEINKFSFSQFVLN